MFCLKNKNFPNQSDEERKKRHQIIQTLRQDRRLAVLSLRSYGSTQNVSLNHLKFLVDHLPYVPFISPIESYQFKTNIPLLCCFWNSKDVKMS